MENGKMWLAYQWLREIHRCTDWENGVILGRGNLSEHGFTSPALDAVLMK